ncbi:MAG: Cyclin transrane N-terminal domain, partial [Verrucomicrobiota bacterium]
MSSAPVYFILLFLVAASALLSAVETAFFSLKPFELEKLRARGGGLAEALGRMLENPRRLLGAVLLGDALVNLPLIILCLWLLRRWAGGVLSFAGLALVVFALVV